MKHYIVTFLIIISQFFWGNVFAYVSDANGNKYYTRTNNSGEIEITSVKQASFSTVYIIPSLDENNGAITAIGDGAFSFPNAIEYEVVLPPSISRVGSNNFLYYCNKIHISSWTSWFSISWGTMNALSKGAKLYYNGELVEEVEIPSNVKTIRPEAFGSYHLRKLTIGPNVTSISNTAFKQVDKVFWTTNTFPSGYEYVLAKVHYYSNAVTADGSNVQFFSNSDKYKYPLLSSMFEVDGGRYVITPDGNSADLIDSKYDSSSANVTVGTTVTYRGRTFPVRNINPYAYYQNDFVENINVSNQGFIGPNAFRQCKNLKSVTLNNTGTIGKAAFKESQIDGQLTVGNSISSLSDSVFASTSGSYIATINVSLRSASFVYSTGLKQLTLGNGVEKIGSNCFYNCSALTDVVLNEGLTTIDTRAFLSCVSLGSIQIPNSVTSLGAESFYGCTALKSAIIGRGINTIQSKVFYYCQLREILIPKEITTIENQAFYACPINTFELEEDNSTITIADDFATSAYNIIIGRKVNHKNTSPWKNKWINTVVYTNNEIKIYPSEFEGNESLRSVKACSSIISIGRSAFSDHTALNNVEIPGVTEIGPQAFKGCSSLKEINCPVVSVIGDSAFYASGLQKIDCPVTSVIGAYAFCMSKNLQSISLSDKLTKLGNSSFKDCSSLQSIYLGKVDKIPYSCFYSCSSLSEISIPDNVLSIENLAFTSAGLKNLLIEDRSTNLSIGVTSAGATGYPMFRTCPLDSVYIGGPITYDTRGSAGYSPFYNNSSLRTVVINDNETTIYDNEFYRCTGLESIKIGNGLDSVGQYAFSYCASLRFFEFGSSLKTIGANAFSDCTGVTSIISHAATPPVCGSQALEDISIWDCTVYVPSGTLAAYMQAPQWRNFFIEELIKRGDVNMDDKINVGDISCIANIVLGKTTLDDYTSVAADVNGDGSVNVGDIPYVAHYILYDTFASGASRSKMMAPASQSIDLYLSDFDITCGQTVEVPISFNIENLNISALQFDLCVPQGLSIITNNEDYAIEKNEERASGHILDWFETENNVLRVICYSLTDKSFLGGDGDIIKVPVQASQELAEGLYDMKLRNIVAANSSKTINLSDQMATIHCLNSPAGISNLIVNNNECGQVYDMMGRKCSGISSGLHVKNGKKFIVK